MSGSRRHLGWRSFSIGRILDDLGQYRAHALAAAIVIVAALILPDPGGDIDLAAPTGTPAVAAQPATPPSPAASTTSTTAPASGSLTQTVADAPVHRPTSTDDAPRAVPPPTTTVPTAPPPTSATRTSVVEPDLALRVTAAGFVSDTAGLGDPDVPPDGYPSSARAGSVSRVTFVRLSGGGSMLELPVHPQADATFGNASLMACPVLAGDWRAARSQEQGDAPEWTCETSSTGTTDGTRWLFDLSAFGEPDRSEGFALVPVAAGAATFQVTFAIEEDET